MPLKDRGRAVKWFLKCMSAMLNLIRPGCKNPSQTLCSAKALREDIVGFKRLFIQPGCVLKLIGFLSMEKIYPWEDSELYNADGTTIHKGQSPSSMPKVREENETSDQHKILKWNGIGFLKNDVRFTH